MQGLPQINIATYLRRLLPYDLTLTIILRKWRYSFCCPFLPNVATRCRYSCGLPSTKPHSAFPVLSCEKYWIELMSGLSSLISTRIPTSRDESRFALSLHLAISLYTLNPKFQTKKFIEITKIFFSF